MESELLEVKHICTICNRTFHTNDSFKIHILEHTEYCVEESVNETLHNVASVANDESRLNPEQLDKPEYQCPICNKAYAGSYSLTVHMYKHTGVYPFTCEICGLGLPTNAQLKTHINKHNGERPHMCTVCGKTFSQKGVLKVHLLTHTDVKPYQCSVCQKPFRHLGSFKRHVSLHGEKRVKRVEQRHECTVCGKKFSVKHELRVHTMTHTGERPHQCEECGKTYTYIESLKCHKRTHSSEKPYQCTMCDKKYRHHGQLRVHSRTHTGERPYTCDVCGKGFVRSSNLKVHMLIHTGERPHKCQICNKGFTIRVKLNSHMRSHTKEKPYRCTVCDKRFTERVTLRKHLVIHSREHPYRCDICKKSFKRVDSFRAHIKIHFSKPYKWKSKRKVFIKNEATEEVTSEAVTKRSRDDKPYHNDGSADQDNGFSDELELHILNHNDKRPRQCKICLQHFIEEGLLKKHMLKHSKAWGHQVTVGKLFDQSVNIQVKQTSEHVYRCSVCSKVFAMRENAMKHLLVHKYVDFLNLKRFLKRHRRSTHASRSNRVFTDKVKLDRHLVKHSGKLFLFKCIFCTSSFVDCKSLKDHILTHVG